MKTLMDSIKVTVLAAFVTVPWAYATWLDFAAKAWGWLVVDFVLAPFVWFRGAYLLLVSLLN